MWVFHSEQMFHLCQVLVTACSEVEEADTEVLFSQTPWLQLTQNILIHLTDQQHQAVIQQLN